MLFHLAHPCFRGKRRVQVERARERLIDRHGEANYLDCTLKLTFPTNPNGVYLLKGGGPAGLAEVRSAELLAQVARLNSRQALWRHGEHRRGCTRALEHIKRA
jgi:hypothetical protein